MPEINFFQEGSPYLDHPLLTPERTKKEIDFILSQIDLPPAGRILDVGCGPGRHGIELARRGYQVVGIDPSETMIHAAQMRAKEAGVTLDYFQEFGEDFLAQDKFDTVLCLFTTLGQINDHKQDNSQLIQSVANNLKFGGYFILEIPQLEWLIDNLKAYECFGEGSSYTEVFRSYAIENNIVTEKFKIHTNQRTHVYLLKYRVYGLHELKDMLTKSNYHTVAIHGGYTEKPLGPDDPNIVVVAKMQRKL